MLAIPVPLVSLRNPRFCFILSTVNLVIFKCFDLFVFFFVMLPHVRLICVLHSSLNLIRMETS